MTHEFGMATGTFVLRDEGDADQRRGVGALAAALWIGFMLGHFAGFNQGGAAHLGAVFLGFAVACAYALASDRDLNRNLAPATLAAAIVSVPSSYIVFMLSEADWAMAILPATFFVVYITLELADLLRMPLPRPKLLKKENAWRVDPLLVIDETGLYGQVLGDLAESGIPWNRIRSYAIRGKSIQLELGYLSGKDETQTESVRKLEFQTREQADRTATALKRFAPVPIRLTA